MLHAAFALTLVAAAAPTDTATYIKPVCAGVEVSGFGYRVDSFTGRTAFHAGLDFKVAIGHPVVAGAAGRVVVAERRGPYGLMVEIDHGEGRKTRYGHLNALAVEPGRYVARGATIGWSGATGRTSQPGLHFEVWFKEVVHDPAKQLRPNPACARR